MWDLVAVDRFRAAYDTNQVPVVKQRPMLWRKSIVGDSLAHTQRARTQPTKQQVQQDDKLVYISLVSIFLRCTYRNMGGVTKWNWFYIESTEVFTGIRGTVLFLCLFRRCVLFVCLRSIGSRAWCGGVFGLGFYS